MDLFVRRRLWVLDLIALGVVAVLAARATAHLADATLLRLCAGEGEVARRAPVTPPPAAHDTDQIIRRDIFCSTCRPRPPLEARQDQRAPPWRLLAIMLAAPPADGRRSVAVIKDENGGAGAYSVGASIDLHVVEAIDQTAVRLRAPDGRTYTLPLLDGAAPIERPPPDQVVAELDAGIERLGENRFGVRRATIESLLGKMDGMAPQARVEPDLRDGKPIGFRLRDVKQDGVFAKIGLREGDLISSVNGLATTGPDNALAIYASLRSVDHLSVGLERAGRRITAEYDIE